MKTKLLSKLSKCFMLATSLVMVACVNSISDDDSQEVNRPIVFTAKIETEGAVTKATDTAFESGDRIGLFAMMAGTPVSGERYIDNLMLTCGEEASLTPEEEVFYPEGGGSLDFVAYYPYRKDALAAQSAMLPVEVSTNQSTHAEYTASDYLLAKVAGEDGSNAKVALGFKHMLSRLLIEIEPEEGLGAEEMLADNPTVTACDFYTKAEYNLNDGTISNLSARSEVVAAGEWKVEGGKLCGKEIIVIPQEVTSGGQSIAVEWNGTVYSCPLTACTLAGNMQRTVVLQINSSASSALTGLVGNIEPWGENTTQDESAGNLEADAVRIGALSFEASNVYRVYHAGKLVAEICKEYLRADNVAAQAIVVYSAASPDNGLVLELLGETENKHGGTVTWNRETGTLSYTEGTSAPIERFYIAADETIATEKPEGTLSVIVTSYVAKFMRADELREYPLVKIGTQYWMRENLHETVYADGTQLTLQTEQATDVAGYFHPEGTEHYFYNGEALLAGELAPGGWRIPSSADWEQLKTYLANDAALVKAGTWEGLQVEDELCSGNNLTFFDGYPVGMWHKGQHWNPGKMVGYWTVEPGADALPEQTVFLTGSHAGFHLDGTKSSAGDFYKALAVRCLRDD